MVGPARRLRQRRPEAVHHLQVQRVRGAVAAVEGPVPLVRRLEHVRTPMRPCCCYRPGNRPSYLPHARP